MKKVFSVLLAVMLLAGTAAAENFRALTGLDEVQARIDRGIRIRRVFYTDGYGFSDSEFETVDPEEISQLWAALNRITVREKTDGSITDWYPQIIFYLSDGSAAGVRFESHWLCIGGRENYELENDGEFWKLTASLVKKYAGSEAGGPVDGGWGTAGNPEITEEVRKLLDKALEGLTGMDYVPAAYLGMQVVGGYNHAILCQAKAVQSQTSYRWVILYLYEDPDGDVTITGIPATPGTWQVTVGVTATKTIAAVTAVTAITVWLTLMPPSCAVSSLKNSRKKRPTG